MTEVRVTAKTARLLRILIEVHDEETKAKAVGGEYHMTSREMMRRSRLAAASFYPIIVLLAEYGWIREVREKLPRSVVRPPHHFYHLTSTGLALAKKAVEEDDKRWRVLRRLGGRR